MQGVKLLIGQAKPSAVQSTNPITRQHKNQKPYDQHSIVNDGAPQKKPAREFNVHRFTSISPRIASAEAKCPRNNSRPLDSPAFISLIQPPIRYTSIHAIFVG